MDLFDPEWMNQLEMMFSVLIAAALGGVVGFERELAKRPAGIRTHAILGAAACLLVALTDTLVSHFATESAPTLLRADPIRVVEAIVTGTAFLVPAPFFARGATVSKG